ncbi:MAG: hypothetical protein Q9M89_03530 [Persephonella sp.]|nr:hypothetical protein [Persephonella sp.]
MNLLRETGDFEKISYKNGKLYLKRKLKNKKVSSKREQVILGQGNFSSNRAS